ncbi:MAG: NAD(P)/FAD-dependent oxidoreductase [Actinobacteria bacterium]|nr:NAD(P)/FAD-dependent oxidoreductase [Actinomycetota bacterium]
MASDYDAIVVGAGHNGLVCANYLARGGKRVLVLEGREVLGGACTTEELIPGARWSSCAFIAGLLRPEIIAELELKKYGLELYQGDALGFVLFRDGSHFMMWKELDRTLRELEKYSKRDAQRFLDFGVRLQRFAEIFRPFLLGPPPQRSEVMAAFEAAGEPELFDEFVLLSTRDLLDRYFESEHLKGFLNFFGMISIWGGPSTPGTSYVYGHHAIGEFDGTFGQFGYARGGMGSISAAIAKSAEAHGAEIKLSTPVAKVIVEGGAAVGVATVAGDEYRAPIVVSNADPQRSLLTLLGPGDLDDDVREEVERIDMRGSMARIHLLIDELPQYLPFDSAELGPQHHGHQMLGASVENYEKAWEAQREGRFPDEWVIEAVIQSATDPTLAEPGRHTMTLGVQQLPYELAGTDWDAERERWADSVMEDLFMFAPNLRDHVLERCIITPKDIERDYGITKGNIFHGAMGLDQLFSSRPLADLSSYATPVPGYFLCGAGTHPGGGVMGANGHNAAQVILGNATAARPRARRRSGGLVGRAMSTKAGRKAGYHLARQPALRPLAKFAARTGGSKDA